MRSKTRLVLAFALATPLLATQSSARAASATFDPAPDHQYCAEVTANINGVTPDGTHLNISATTSASAWTGSNCYGASAPEGYYDSSFELLFTATGRPPYSVVYLDDELNDYNLWGTYLATVGDASPFGGVDIPASALQGPGYYMLEVGAADTIGAAANNVVQTPWTYVSLPYPYRGEPR